MAEIRDQALRGHVWAQTIWAQALLNGNSVKADPKEARHWFRIAADAGYPPAINMLGRCLERGWGGTVDYHAAAQAYERAIAGNDDWARYNLGNMCLRGRGVRLDRDRAFTLFMTAACNGHAKAMNLAARCLEEGWGCTRDRAEATSWYRQSAEAGDYRGQHNYAVLLAEAGRTDEAMAWWEKALPDATPDIRDAMRAALSHLEHPNAPKLLAQLDGAGV